MQQLSRPLLRAGIPFFGCLIAFALFALQASAQQPSQIRFRVTQVDGTVTPCRIHLFNASGEPQRAAGQPFWHDHFVCSGEASVDVAPGRYRWEVERGPEWQRAAGQVAVEEGRVASVAITLSRIAQLRSEGWYSGDLHVHRPVDQIEALMLAEDLDFAPVITWWNRPAQDVEALPQTVFPFDGHRLYSVMAGEDEREGGALLYFGLNRPLDLSVESREFPSPMDFVMEARKRNPQVWIDIEKPFWWDVPTWLATGQMNSIGLANNHMCRSQMLANEAWGRPRDRDRFPDPLGNGYWTQAIYYRLLSTGLRLPPSAGSASGVLPNPVGYNRVYVHLGDQSLTRDAWFDALRQGRCFVTNGPLLRAEIDGTKPGSELTLPDGQARELRLSIQLTSLDRISKLEIIHNGKVVESLPCSAETDQTILASLPVREPGWLIIRAIAEVDQTFRFASTAPWYLQSTSGDPPISRAACEFFLDWLGERIERLEANVSDPAQLDAVRKWHLQAREFWIKRRDQATTD